MVRRRPALLLAATALLLCAAVLLGACAGASPAAQTIADPGPSSTPSFQSGDNPELEVDPDTTEDPDPTPEAKPTPTSKDDGDTEKEDGAEASSAEGRQTRSEPSQSVPQTATEYTWQDGDRVLKVTLQPDLVLQDEAAPVDEGVSKVKTGKGVIVRKGDTSVTSGQPVFRSPSGALMTLPGGVLLVLEDAWTEAEVNAFFARNGIKLALVSELSYATNGFFVETDPGLPSLEMANNLASQEGVVVSSPNWWTQVATR